MLSFVHSQNFQFLTGIAIGSVWVFHGLYSKILSGMRWTPFFGQS